MRRPRLIFGGLIVAAVGASVAVALVLTTSGERKRAAPRRAATGVALPAIYRANGFFAEPARVGRGTSRRENPLLDRRIEGPLEVARQAYALRAYPAARVTFAEAQVARRGFAGLPFRLRGAAVGNAARLGLSGTWHALGAARFPALAPGFQAKGIRELPYTTSGRVASLAIAPTCVPGDCRLWVGTAGGGIFRTEDALAAKPAWTSASSGVTSGAIGSITVDPHDPTGNTLYAGTGEEESFADSEAGTGVFRSTDGGDTWELLPGSARIARDRAVPSIAIDPRDPRTIYVATAISVHGASSVRGGESEPPGAAPLGLYRSTDGGETFANVFTERISQFLGPSLTASVNEVAFDPNDPGTIYAAVTAAGLFRQSRTLDGDAAFHQIFQASNRDPLTTDPVRFALADLGARTRIYVGDSSTAVENPVSELFRVDAAAVPAASLLGPGRTNAGWTRLSSKKPASPGFDSFDYCSTQCDWDNVVVTPPGRPDSVWLGGMFRYDEAYVGVSHGRAVLRSNDAGVHFTDLTTDARSPTMALHPDEHAIVFSPGNPEIAFIGSDGGLARTSGAYADASRTCAGRGLGKLGLARCRRLLSAVPTKLSSLNDGLQTLQLFTISVGPKDGTVLTGSQDNGTWEFSPQAGWRQTAGGDGGQSGFAPRNPRIRFHTFYEADIQVNFGGFDPRGWDITEAPLLAGRENVSFYLPLAVDARVPGGVFAGLEHVWRTTDYGGRRPLLDARCNEARLEEEGADRLPDVCGDWKPLGFRLTGPRYGDRAGGFVVNVKRAPSDARTLWAATLAGRVLVSTNAYAPARSVRFARIDLHGRGAGKSTPGRFVSGIAVDRTDPDHAWVSFSGYDKHTPGDIPGHVFEVRFNPAVPTASWTNLTYDLPDMPITDLVQDPGSGDLYASTDFGVLRLATGARAWTDAAPGLPVVAVYGLTVSPDGRTLYAATHGRGAWILSLR